MKNFPSKSPRITLGKWGEVAALNFLLDKGFQCLERNFRCPDGEIDLVMLENDELVFVEVKTRKSIKHSFPEESITDEKLDHMEASANWYLESHTDYVDNWRFDVIAIIGSPIGGLVEIKWFRDIRE